MIENRLLGIGALLVATCYLTGFAALFGPFASLDLGTASADPADLVAFVTRPSGTPPGGLMLWYAVIYDASALGTALASLALARTTARTQPLLGYSLGAAGLMWSGLTVAAGQVARAGLAEAALMAADTPALAAEIWRFMHLIELALSGHSEVLGGLWIGLASLAGLRLGLWQGVPCMIGLVVGTAGVLSYVPLVSDGCAAFFGLGAIMWFLWVAVEALLHSKLR